MAGVAAVYTSLFGIGKIVFGELGVGLLVLLLPERRRALIQQAAGQREQEERAKDGRAVLHCGFRCLVPSPSGRGLG